MGLFSYPAGQAHGGSEVWVSGPESGLALPFAGDRHRSSGAFGMQPRYARGDAVSVVYQRRVIRAGHRTYPACFGRRDLWFLQLAGSGGVRLERLSSVA